MHVRLSPEQVSFFHREGYLFLEKVLEPASLRALQEETARLHERLSEGNPSGVMVSWEVDRGPGNARRVQQVLNAHRISPTLDSVIGSDQILGVMEGLIGPEVAIFESKFLMKSSHVGGEIPLHQDYAYWAGVSPAPLQANCMIYIDDADDENGCLQVVPRSHQAGLRSHRSSSGASVFRISVTEGATLRPDERIVSIPGKAGSAIFFGPLLLHRSGANRTPRERRSATIVYTMPGIRDQEVGVLRARTELPDLQTFFGLHRVKAVQGPGPHAGQCASGYRRRELLKLAAAHVPGGDLPWVDLCASRSDLASFEWLAAHKPAAARMIRAERYPKAVSTRGDVVVYSGGFDEVTAVAGRAELPSSVAFAHVDCETYLATRSALDALRSRLRPGSVLLLRWFHGLPGWQRRTALAFHDWLREGGFTASLLGRSDFDLAVKLEGSSGEDGPRVPAVEWTPAAQGLTFSLAPDDVLEPPPAPRPTASRSGWWSRWSGRGMRSLRRVAAVLQRSAGGDRRGEGFFPRSRILVFRGEGAPQSLCPTHERRRALWQHAARLVDRKELAWCEFGVGEGESLDWFALHKPLENVLFGFDSFEGLPEPWGSQPAGQWRTTAYSPNRDDVRIVVGPYVESLARVELLRALGSRIGLLHIDCDLYSSTRCVLRSLGGLIGAGTVIVFDEFYGYPGWEDHEARAFREFVHDEAIEFEWIARADFQVAVRILGRGTRPRWKLHGEPPTCSSEGLYVERG
jgi:ectoine hydroxylase-related dioxygenase (phytanoyl-CoA dioxygenase family)